MKTEDKPWMHLKGISLARVSTLVALRRVTFDRPLQLITAVCDHFAPMWQRPTRNVEDARVACWVRGYSQALAGLGISTAGRRNTRFPYQPSL